MHTVPPARSIRLVACMLAGAIALSPTAAGAEPIRHRALATPSARTFQPMPLWTAGPAAAAPRQGILDRLRRLADPNSEDEGWRDIERYVERYRDRPLVLRPTREHHRRVYLWNDPEGTAYAIHEGDDLFPVTEPTRVRVRDADPETDHIEIDLESTDGQRGRVSFYGREPSVAVFRSWMDEIFETETPERNFTRYFADTVTGVLHARGSEHRLPEDEREVVEDPHRPGGQPLQALHGLLPAAAAGRGLGLRERPTGEGTRRCPRRVQDLAGPRRPLRAARTGRGSAGGLAGTTEGVRLRVPSRRTPHGERLRAARRPRLRDQRAYRCDRQRDGAQGDTGPRSWACRVPPQLPGRRRAGSRKRHRGPPRCGVANDRQPENRRDRSRGDDRLHPRPSELRPQPGARSRHVRQRHVRAAEPEHRGGRERLPDPAGDRGSTWS